MKTKYSIGKRLIAMVLTLALILSIMPLTGLLQQVSAAEIGSAILKTEADTSTMDSWKDVFNPTNLTTEHAGGIWTDKSVITAGNIPSAFGNIAGLEAGEKNFLVALSALAANSVVVGQGTTPTDTILVLDISGSMSATNLRAMVAAANDAIHTLLGNPDSRVGVVLYASSASVLLPLDRYTPVTETQNTDSTADDVIEYIEYSNSRIRAARVQTGNGNQGRPGGGNQNNQNNYSYIKNSNGDSVTTSINTGGGTYIQGGLYTALEQFNAATVSDARAPVLVLMSDGAPTFVTNDFNAVPDSYESGDGNSSEDGEGFLTQLTAAYVKAQIAKKYNSTAYMYTLGLGVSSSNNTVGVAEAVLDTTKTRTGMNTYWNTYLGLASKTDKTMDVEVHRDSWSNDNTTDVTVTYDAVISQESQKSYVDKYFPASSASDLSAAFKGIVNEINLKSSYYVTRLDGADANQGGYITFVDEIGTGMEVKEIEGILIGNTLYTGELMAQALENGSLGTKDEPTILGDNMVWALIRRLDIKDTANETAKERAHDLLRLAYNAGQLHYDAETGAWSNYIGWFGDANGDYIGFWDAADPNAAIPEGAAYANMCYGMLGTTSADQTAHASDMMYVAVQISKPITNTNGTLSIQANSPQTVTFRIPAALLPTITYQISVDVGSNGQITENSQATIAYSAADPIRLVYEVGVHSELTPENISQFVRAGYQAKDANGNYYLYTNAWYWDGADDTDWTDESNHPQKGDAVLKDTGKNKITYAYFEPGEDNEHYYFTEDSLVYVKNGSSYIPYEGSTRPSGTYYFKHLIYTATADATDGAKAVTATITAHYEELSSAALLKTEQTEGAQTWYVPEGTMHRNMHDHDRNKTQNVTGSFSAVRHQLVDQAVNGDLTHHYEIVYMGNNGRITYAPAQGFNLTKVMAGNADANGQSFTFTVTVTGDTDGKITVTRDGVSEEKALTSGQLQLSLAAGETVQVSGMDIGATYTVTENVLDGFRLSAIAARADAVVDNAAGTVRDTVQSNVFHDITFTNDIQYYGSLLISKDIEYLKNSQPAQTNTDAFQVKVTLSGMGGKSIYVDGAATTLNDGVYTFTITDGKSVLLSGIPAGTAYTVEEVLVDGTMIPAGYTAADGYTAIEASFSGAIAANETASALLENQYEPADVVFNDVAPKITVQTGKTVIGQPLNNWSFDFELLYYNGANWEPVVVNGVPLTVTVDQAEGTDSFSLNGVKLTTVGKHYFRVAEIDPKIAGMTYDRTFHDFEVVVVDDLSGQLKIESVNSVQHAQVTPPAAGEEGWNVITSFENEYEVGSTSLTIQANKRLWNTTGGGKTEMALSDGQFWFTLYSADENFENLTKIEDTRNGVAGQIIFTHIPYHFDPNSTETTYYYVVKETGPAQPGYTFDDAVYNIAVTVKQVSVGNTSEMQITAVTVNGNPVTLGEGNVLNGNTITFENTYKAEAATGIVLEGNKLLQGKDLEDDMFSFILEGPNNYSETVTNKGGKFTFSALSFDQVGSYTYTIREENGGSTVNGITYDGKTITVTVDVEDNGAGQLIAKIGGSQVTGTYHVGTFENTYAAAATDSIVLSGSKDLQVSDKFDRPLKAGEFSFTLTRPDGSTETVTNDANGNFSFSALSFGQEGSYIYTIREVHGGNVRDGVTYDSRTISVTINVVNDGMGKLVAKVGNTQIDGTYHVGTFENTYEAASVPVQLTAHKYLHGDRELKANEFSFTLTKPNGSTEVATNDEEGLVTFAQITFDSVGKYEYHITENKLDENGQPLTPNAEGQIVYKGVTYSLAEYTVTVEVVDNGLGQLLAHVTTVDAHGNELPAQFFNRYAAQSVTVNLTGDNDKDGIKTLNDMSSGTDKKDLDDFEFKFVLTDEAGNVIETVSDNGKGFNFADITYNETGEHIYYISELDGGAAGVTYDQAKFKVTVKITDNGQGDLVADVSYQKITQDSASNEVITSANEVAFTNIYQADPAVMQVEGLKTMVNLTPGVVDPIMNVPDGIFSFRLTALNGAPMAEGNTIGYEIVSNQGGQFRFSPIHYTVAGTYRYALSEEDTSAAGVTKDNTVHSITVVVSDVAGQLTAAIQYDGNAVSGNTVQAAFRNTYKAAPATGIVLGGSKKLEGGPALENGQFRFILTKPDGTTDIATNWGERFTFSALRFDTVGTYVYTISEENGGQVINGIAYDDRVITVTVEIVDNGSGQLVANVNGNETTRYYAGVFTNQYTADSVTVNLTGDNDKDGVKNLEDKTSQTDKTLDDFEFRFQLTDENGNVLETVSDNGKGFNFKNITYTEVGQYIYYIRELDDGAPGVSYDKAAFKVTVKVTDNGEGKLEAAVSYEWISGTETVNADEVIFTNTYKAKETSVAFTGVKTLEGTRELRAGEFSFVLKDAAGKELQTVTNAADGTFTFDAITYTAEGKYLYTLAEVQGTDTTVTYDATVYALEVVVTDENGELKAVVQVAVGDEKKDSYGFTNIYKAKGTAVTLAGLKTLEGSRELREGEFSFVLKDAAGKELQTVTNAADGTFTFDAITYTEAGKYVYTLEEVQGTDTTVTYDPTVYTLTVTVTDENGELKAVVHAAVDTESKDSYGFTNIYKAKETSVTFAGLKVLEGGRKLRDGEFSFVLKDADGNVLQTVTNTADGIFTFDAIPYTEAGKYVYTLEEVQGSDTSVTYDTTVYTLTVTVTDVNGELQAVVQASVDGENKESYGFTNLFVPKGAVATVTVEKVLDDQAGANMGLEGFLFDLYCNETGKTVTIMSGADGLAVLELAFSAEDIGKVYTYKLTEQAGDIANMEYSNVVYDIQVAVSQDAETGELVLTVTRDGVAATGNAQFVNVLHPENPKTGEELFIGSWAALMGISAICLLAVLVLGKKKTIEA